MEERRNRVRREEKVDGRRKEGELCRRRKKEAPFLEEEDSMPHSLMEEWKENHFC